MPKYVVLYDPKEHVKQVHKCDLPDLTVNRDDERRKIWWKTIVECEECAKRWVAITYLHRAYENKWIPLRWYHFKYKRNLHR
jgi:hypothetical protein